MSPQPFDSLKGFAVTFGQIFKKPITQQYPEYKRPVYPRFRGRHRLWRHENGLEKCVGCSLCAAACPADCIRVVADENTADNRVSRASATRASTRSTSRAASSCGYCELACPFDAITLEAEYELSEYSRDDLIYTKDMLLAPPVKRVPVADRDLYDTPIPCGGRSRDELHRLGRLGRGGALASRSGIAVVPLPEPLLQRARPDREPRLARGPLPASRRRSSSRPRRCSSTRAPVVVMFLFVIAYLGGRADAPWAGKPSAQSLGRATWPPPQSPSRSWSSSP
jgi:NADH-quinone oxidoreductase subunit I